MLWGNANHEISPIVKREKQLKVEMKQVSYINITKSPILLCSIKSIDNDNRLRLLIKVDDESDESDL